MLCMSLCLHLLSAYCCHQHRLRSKKVSLYQQLMTGLEFAFIWSILCARGTRLRQRTSCFGLFWLGFLFCFFSSTKHEDNFLFRHLSFASQWECFNVLKVTPVRLCRGRRMKRSSARNAAALQSWVKSRSGRSLGLLHN